MNDTEKRIAWKNIKAQQHYGQSYASLCCDRKRIIDQTYQLYLMEEDEKKNGKKRGCR